MKSTLASQLKTLCLNYDIYFNLSQLKLLIILKLDVWNEMNEIVSLLVLIFCIKHIRNIGFVKTSLGYNTFIVACFSPSSRQRKDYIQEPCTIFDYYLGWEWGGGTVGLGLVKQRFSHWWWNILGGGGLIVRFWKI